MKTITHFTKLLIAIIVLVSAKTGLAQNCTPTFSYVQGANGQVTFYGSAPGSTSVNPGTYTWMFLPSNTMVNGQTTTNTYSANGVYTVALLYLNSAMTCSAGTSQTIQITNVNGSGCNLLANFNYSQGPNGQVFFSNTSTGVASGAIYVWQFGDLYTSGAAAPSHTYAANGTYTVKLYVSNNTTPACDDSIAIPITINSYCNLSASFSYTQNSNGQVGFSNTSTGTNSLTSVSWSFGDGLTGNAASSTHNYQNGGTYTVTLAINSLSCSSTATQVITVTNTCVANAGFSLSPTNTAQVWNAFVLYPTNVSNAVWSWGDGSTSNTLYTSHTYSAAGTYSICLSVTLTCGNTANYCAPYAIYKTSEDMSIILINVVNPAVATGIKNQSAEQASYVVSPNPNNGAFNLSLKGIDSKNVSINLYNIQGKLVYSAENEINAGSLDKNIQLDEAANGVYFLKVNTGNSLYTQKVVIGGR